MLCPRLATEQQREGNLVKAILSWILDLKWSIVGLLLAAIGAFLSLGVQGLALYGLVSPVLNLIYPPLESWDQSIVWPLIVGAGLLWSLSFLPAGLLDRSLKARGTRRRWRVLAYLGVLWVGGLLAWLLVLITNPVL